MARMSAVVVAFLAFVVLGLPEVGLGTAWPSLRLELGRPVEDLGVILVAMIAGYQLTSVPSGRIAARIGTAGSVIAAAGLSLLGLVGFAIAPSWSLALVSGALIGMGAGLTDTAFNAYAALEFDGRQTNLLHAGFGIGATAGPIVMTSVLAAGAGWRIGYLVFAAMQLAMLVVLFARRTDLATPVRVARSGGRLSVRMIITFFMYTGLEVAAGQWAFTLLTEGRGMGVGLAGAWVAAYWGGLTLGRLAFGVAPGAVAPARVVRLGAVGAIAGMAMLWWDPGGWGHLGLPLGGLSLAGIFPALVTLTPSAVGADRSSDAIGLQLAAASAGAAALPWAAGRVVGLTSLEALGPALVVMAVGLLALHPRTV